MTMTAEVEVHGGGELSSQNDLPNGNAIADSSCVFVEVSGNDVGSGGTDLNSTNSVELNGKLVVEESNQSTINNEENEIESEKQESLVLVSESFADQENQLLNLSAKEAELGDQKFESGGAESGTVVVSDSVDGDGAVSCKNYSSENAASLHTDLPAETACENGAVDMIHEIQVADCPEELGVEIDQNTEEASRPVAVAVAGVDLQLGMQIVRGSVTVESERGLDAGHCQYGVSETVVDDLVDPSQETAELDKPSGVAESFPFQIDPENLPVESLKTDPDVALNVSDTTAKPDVDFRDSVVTESSPSGEVDDMERDNEVGKLNVGSGKSSDSHPVDDAHVNEVGNGPVRDDLVSVFHNSDAKSETETGFDSVDAEEKVSILASDDQRTEPEVLQGGLPSDNSENVEEESGGAASVPVPMPDLALPASFDSDNPTHRYRYLDSSNQWLVRPVLETHGWDHDVGYEGINAERLFVVKNKIPISFSGQVTKDKKDANVQMEVVSSLKHGEGKATSLGFDMQTVGKDLAYTLRSETRFSNFRKNKAMAGLSVTHLGDSLSAGVKVEDKLIVNKRFRVVMTGGAMTSRSDVAYGGSLEAQLRDADYPLGRSLTTLGLSVMDWHGDLAIGCNIQSQVPIGRSTNMIGRANLNNRGAGQVSIRVNSSEQLQLALIGLIPLLKKLLGYSQQMQLGQ